MAVTRVLLARLPVLLADIVRGLAAEHGDVRIVGEVAGLDGVPAGVRETRADVVVVGGTSPSALASLVAAVHGARATTRIVAIDDDGVGATVATAAGCRRVAPLSARGLLELVLG